jgi:rhodanese-related sulfurtransferase
MHAHKVTLITWLAALLAVALLTGCGEPGPELSAPEAYARAADDGLRLIDIRTPREWRQTGVAEPAHRIDMAQPGGSQAFVAEVLALTDGDKAAPIALICATGSRSGRMQRLLAAEGLTAVYNVREGMLGSGAGLGWIRRGLPLTACPAC